MGVRRLANIGAASSGGRDEGLRIRLTRDVHRPRVRSRKQLSAGYRPRAGSDTRSLAPPIKFVLRGTGTCTAVNIDWGDGGQPQTHTYFNGIRFSGSTSFDVESRTVKHTFSGWGGGKTVTAEAARGCRSAKVNLRFNVPPLERQLALAQPGVAAGTNMCVQPTPPLPAMMPRSLVHIQTTALERPFDRGINFGCFAAGCVHDADGRAGTVAASPFPLLASGSSHSCCRSGHLSGPDRKPTRGEPIRGSPPPTLVPWSSASMTSTWTLPIILAATSFASVWTNSDQLRNVMQHEVLETARRTM